MFMRTLILLVYLGLIGCSHYADDDWLGQDKALHFAGSALLTAAAMEAAQQRGYAGGRKARFGLLFSLSFGIGKELHDSRPQGSGWSWKDLIWDVAGSAAGYTLYQALD